MPSASRAEDAPYSLWSILLVTLILSYPLAVLLQANFGNAVYLAYASIGVTVLSCAAIAFRSPRRFGRLLLVMLAIAAFIGCFLLSGKWYVPEKLTTLLGVIAVFGLLPGFALSSDELRRHLVPALIAIGCVTTFFLLVGGVAHAAGRVSAGDNNPIWVGRLAAYLIIAGAYCISLPSFRKVQLGIALCMVGVAAVIMTGSRGPLIAGIAAIAVSAIFFARIGGATKLFIVLLAMTALTALLGYDLLPQGRALGIFDPTGDGLSGQRTLIYPYTMELIRSAPDGVGVGGFQFHEFTYPHNIFLEALAEWGIGFGAVIILAILASTIRLLRQDFAYAHIIKLIAVVDLINAMVSGDLTSPRLLYAVLILSWLMPGPARARSGVPGYRPALDADRLRLSRPV